MITWSLSYRDISRSLRSDCNSRVALTLRNLAISIAHTVSIKAKPFASVSARAVMSTPYPFRDTVHGTVKCFPPIN